MLGNSLKVINLPIDSHVVGCCPNCNWWQCKPNDWLWCKLQSLYVIHSHYLKYFIYSIDRVIANYMMWQAVVHLAPYLSEEYHRAFYNYRKVVMGTTGETDIWQKCITEMSRYDNEIGDPLGVVFLNEKFNRKDKESVRVTYKKFGSYRVVQCI